MTADSHREYAAAAERWFAKSAGPARLRELIDGEPVSEGAGWRAFSGFGLGELITAEADPTERAHILAQVALQAGRFLYPGPLAEAIGRELIGLPAAPGELVVVVLPEADASAPAWNQRRRRLTGTLRYAPYAGAAERWLIAGIDAQAPVLVAAAPSPATVHIDLSRQADGTANATLRFSAHPVDAGNVIASGAPAAGLIANLRDVLVMTTAARLIGAAEQATALARDYLKMRTQFGRTLASFQALQHQAVDHYIDLQLGRSLLDQVLLHWADPAIRRVALPALKAFSATAGLNAAKNAVQMFGAMGFAHESDVGLYLRHVLTLACRHGDALQHRRAFTTQEFDFLS